MFLYDQNYVLANFLVKMKINLVYSNICCFKIKHPVPFMYNEWSCKSMNYKNERNPVYCVCLLLSALRRLDKTGIYISQSLTLVTLNLDPQRIIRLLVSNLNLKFSFNYFFFN